MPVLVRSRLRRQSINQSNVQHLAQRILACAGHSRDEVGVELVGDRRMRRLNRHYRGHDRSTDVLAFSLREGPGPASCLLGDVVISIDAVRRQAREAGHSADQELAILLVHGILHLLGYDHERDPREAQRMFRKQRAILTTLRPLPKLLTGGRHA